MTGIIDSFQNSTTYIVSKVPFNRAPEKAWITASAKGKTASRYVTLLPMPKFIVNKHDMCPGDFSFMNWTSYCHNWDFRWNLGIAKLTIESPQDTNISFYYGAARPLGRSIEISPDSLSLKYTLHANKTKNKHDTTEVIVKCEILGTVQYDTTYIHPSPDHFIMEANADRDTTKHGEETPIGIWYGTDGYCWEQLPDTTSIYANILHGMKFGSLRDNINWTIGDNSIKVGLSEYGNSEISFIADGEEPKDLDSVVIRFTSKNPMVIPASATIYIKPAMVRVILIPDNISPGDTADIKLEKWNDETKKYDPFGPSQIFDIGVVGGCEYGNILWNNKLQSGFTNICGSVKFVADSTISPDSVASNIRVNIPEEGGVSTVSTKPAAENTTSKAKTEEKSLSKQNHIESSKNNKSDVFISKIKSDLQKRFRNVPENIRNKILQSLEKHVNKKREKNITGDESSCAYVPETEKSGEANILIANCNKILSSCDDPMILPDIELNLNPSGLPSPCIGNEKELITGTVIKIQSGGFQSYVWNNQQNVEAIPCFNKDNGMVHFNIQLEDLEGNIDNKLRPKATLSICSDQIKEAKKILISTDDEMLQILRSNPNDSIIFKKDLELWKHYDSDINKYYFKNEALAHETKHKTNFTDNLTLFKKEWFDDKIKEYKISCKEFKKDKITSTNHAMRVFVQIIKEYIAKAKRASDAIEGEPIQQSNEVKETINHYLKLLEDFKTGKIK